MIGHGEDLGCQPEGSTACLTVHACLNHQFGCLPGNVWRPHLPLFSSEGNLGQRIFCSLLEMHHPWSSRIKMIQCFKIYRTLLDYVGLFCFVCFAVLNFGLVQESPILRAYLLRDISCSTNNSHLWLTLIKQLLLLAFPVCLFPCTNPIFHLDGPIHSYSWCVCLVCLWISGHLSIHVSHLFLSPVSVYLIAIGWDICRFVYAYILQEGRSVYPHTMDWRRAPQACILLHVEEK